MSLRIEAVVDKFVLELKEALDADIQDRIMKEREMQCYIEEREREVAEREAAWKAELYRRESHIMVDDGKKGAEGVNSSDKKMATSYTLTANDNPGNIITQVQLKGENYDEWARAVRIALHAKKKYGFVDGTINKPRDDSPDIEDWWTVNSMLVSWVLNTIEPTLRSTISYMESVKDLWEEIRQRFSIGNGPRVQQLRTDLANCKQEGQGIVVYYGRLKSVWDELNNYDTIPICNCHGCSCNISSKLENKREEERVHQFLMGLDDEAYGTVRSNILSMDPLPNLNRVYALVVQQERVRTMTRTREDKGNPMSFAVQLNGRSTGMDDKDKPLLCSSCKRKGHLADNCFQRIGYPEWWGDRPRTTPGRRGTGRGRGALQVFGGGRGRGSTARVNAVQAIDGDGINNSLTSSDRSGISGLNDEQWTTLLSMLNTHKGGIAERLTGKPSLLPWIIDTGASHHMTGTYDCLSDVHDIVPSPVGLPNGAATMAVKEGTVIFGETFRLQHVLFVPKLKCNLISVSQLLDDSNLVVQFTNKFCAIQDRTSRMLIGAGEQREGLYFLKGVEAIRACQATG